MRSMMNVERSIMNVERGRQVRRPRSTAMLNAYL